MLKSHEKFHSVNGKRLILIADDEMINRELLSAILENDYELIYAANGQEALDLIRKHRNLLSLVLLDLMMPVMNGLELLKQVKKDPELQRIPIIVLTSDQQAEVESLTMGAIDFIPKPYPQAGVIQARVLRTIELSEDRDIIQSTERDALTGLYNREYFYRYAEQYYQHHGDTPMDAMVVDVNHFHMINERFGTNYGDSVLRRIGEKVLEMVEDSGGIVCRREADTFMIYCPHGKDYKAILDSAADGLAGDDAAETRVRLRMGVYANVDKSLDIERRFDRAKSAADTVRNSFNKTIGFYDDNLHERELYAEQLIEGFHKAITEKQFKVYYQPKFDVRPEIPVLASAEALVRWHHPVLGTISPGVFVPLFEDNGLIQTLDDYVWRMAAAQIRDWKDRFGFSVPVSVNVSRIDMYDPNLTNTFRHILSEYDLTAGEFMLEITESAYTQDSEQIIETVSELREMGFRIEMDDFGTGYSSLNMISMLPIDALKLDMQFIRTAFDQRKDTRLLEVIIDIADYLSVPVIAEGVETEEQLRALKAMGCDLVQGYYFSKPVPPVEYERFVIERKDQHVDLPDVHASRTRSRTDESKQELTFGRIAYALSSGFESVYYVDTDNNHYVEFSSEGRYEDLQIECSGADFFADTLRNIPRVVYQADRERVSLSMQKETLLAQLVDQQPFHMTYRLLIDGKPTYYMLKAVRANTHDNHHIVLGISNVDEQMKEAAGLKPKASLRADISDTPDFNSLAMALTSDMESIYYVNTETDAYMEFVSSGAYGSLDLEITGENFFDECSKNIQSVIYPDDRDKITAALKKEQLLQVLSNRRSFTIDYRILIDGGPVYYRIKSMPAKQGDLRHVILGVSNIDAQITDEQKLAAERQSAVTYTSIAEALSQDYFSIYYVNTETDRFIEYCSDETYQELGIEQSGEDFFNLSRKNALRVVYQEDQTMLREALVKENLMRALSEERSFTLTYRLLFRGRPVYVHLKAIRMEDKNNRHIVIGVSDIDAQMRREQEQARALRSAKEAANRDALTGVKSKHAFAEAEAYWNGLLAQGEAAAFAVAVCDLNGLKHVNDTLGHKAGDQYIRDASAAICNTFKHSPVYRIGGDEFVVILSGSDYAARAQLVETFAEENAMRARDGGVVVACGIADLQLDRDKRIESVFDRADAAMYENKLQLKAIAG